MVEALEETRDRGEQRHLGWISFAVPSLTLFLYTPRRPCILCIRACYPLSWFVASRKERRASQQARARGARSPSLWSPPLLPPSCPALSTTPSPFPSRVRTLSLSLSLSCVPSLPPSPSHPRPHRADPKPLKPSTTAARARTAPRRTGTLRARVRARRRGAAGRGTAARGRPRRGSRCGMGGGERGRESGMSVRPCEGPVTPERTRSGEERERERGGKRTSKRRK